MTDIIRIETEGRVAMLTLNRPDRGNALDAAMVEALLAALDRVEGSGVDTVVLRGAGNGFCGGFDLGGLDAETDGSLLLRFIRIELLLQRLHHLPLRTVAIAHRYAYGAGADLFSACRIRLADPGTRFAFPGVRFGLALGTNRLARQVGATAALDMLNSVVPIDAAQAAANGLVTELVAVADWPERLTRLGAQEVAIDRDTLDFVLPRIIADERDADLAALVRSAVRPGLKQRIASHIAARSTAHGKTQV
jgi:enoyl-CoA hydratase/carnithine racemase